MALKYEVTTLEGIPDAVKPLYAQKDGRFVLDVEGVVAARDLAEANGKVVEFRDTNVKLLKALGAESVDAALQRAAIVAGIDPAKLEKLKGIDPDEHATLKAKIADLEKKGVKSGDDVSAQIKAALDAALGPLQQELAGERKARTEAQQRADESLLRQTIGEKATKAGLKPGALDFIVGQAKQTFRVVDGQVKAVDGKFSADKLGEALGIDEWLARTAKDFDFAFAPSQGGGAPGGAGNGSGAPAAKAGAKQIVNPTPQELGRLKFVAGKGLTDPATGQVVQIVRQ